jgi:hypothetical protein
MSMKDAGILDGDLVAVHRTPEVRSRQIVVARLDDEVTVKRYRQEGRIVWLLPENADFEPIRVDLDRQAVIIEGVVVGVVRKDRRSRPERPAPLRRNFSSPSWKTVAASCWMTRGSGGQGVGTCLGRPAERLSAARCAVARWRLAGGMLTEIAVERWGSGELALFMPLLARLSRPGGERQGWIAWISPPFLPYAPALAAAGVDLARVCCWCAPGMMRNALGRRAGPALGQPAGPCWPGRARGRAPPAPPATRRRERPGTADPVSPPRGARRAIHPPHCASACTQAPRRLPAAGQASRRRTGSLPVAALQVTMNAGPAQVRARLRALGDPRSGA